MSTDRYVYVQCRYPQRKRWQSQQPNTCVWSSSQIHIAEGSAPKRARTVAVVVVLSFIKCKSSPRSVDIRFNDKLMVMRQSKRQ
jgi:hypothetical protein